MFLFLAFMVVRNVMGHLSIELLPSSFVSHPLWGWTTTTTHHALHHRDVRSNFGLYSTFWDRLMGTTHPEYEAASVQQHGGRAPGLPAHGRREKS